MSFIYELSEIFVYPTEKVRYIFNLFGIDYIYNYQILSDTDCASLQFVIFSKVESEIPESMYTEILFIVIKNSDILKRFDLSDESWMKFGVQNEKTRKQMGLFEIESICDLCFKRLACNPKEYIEQFKSEAINKKHKGIKKQKKQ